VSRAAPPARAADRPPPPPRVDVAGIRRDQIVTAAAEVVAARGIQHLSLSAIEAHTGMSRGQLTYYFKTKEDILLAVFDRMVWRMREQVRSAGAPCAAAGGDTWVLIQGLLTAVLTMPPPTEFTQLQYTFLAQTGHRDDFRERLASLYEDWRTHMASGLAADGPAADPRLLASLVQALVHGLVMQLQADPAAFDRAAMLDLCLAVLGRARGTRAAGRRPAKRPRKPARPAANPSSEGQSDV